MRTIFLPREEVLDPSAFPMKVLKCPDCPQWHTIQGNALNHAEIQGHGEPELVTAEIGNFTPSKQKFKYYLHDGYNRFESREHLENQGIELSEEAWENFGKPFYEVTLECEVDADGNVTLLEARL